MASGVRRRWRLVLAGLLVVLSGCLLVCWYFRIWSRQDYRDYHTLEDYALGHDLWHGRIVRGQDVEDVTLKASPHRISRLGRFTELWYYPGGPPDGRGIPFESMALVAKDGKLVSAGAAGCTWQRWFFRMSREDEVEYQKCFMDVHGR
jgi:hypothetical protein